MEISNFLDCIEIPPKAEAKASIIWLHGLGASGDDFVPAVRTLNLPENLGLRFVFPNAPVRPVTVNQGYRMPAWYDILGFSADSREDESGILNAEQRIQQILEREQELGIPSHKIVLAGFSQGGALALFSGLRYHKPLAGIMGLSTYLPISQTLLNTPNQANQNTPFFIAHGQHDPVVPLSWGLFSQGALTERGYGVEWRTYPIEHHVSNEELRDISGWLQKILCEQ